MSSYRKTDRRAPEKAPAINGPIEVANFSKNRGRNESVRIWFDEYKGHLLINVRVFATGTDGIDRPTPKGVSMGIRKLPELTRALLKAEDKAKEMGLLQGEFTE